MILLIPGVGVQQQQQRLADVGGAASGRGLHHPAGNSGREVQCGSALQVRQDGSYLPTKLKHHTTVF